MSDDNVSMAEIVEAARQQGWSPDKGDLSPLEFLAKGREFRDRLYDDVKSLRTENEKLYKVVSEHITSQKKKDTVSETAKVEADIRKATEDGDPDKVIELTKKLKPPVEENDPNLEFIDTWTASNKWFNENPEMKSDALGFYHSEKIKLGVDNPQAILPKVEERMKKLYPDYFKPKNPNEGRDAGVEKGGKGKPAKKSGLSESDLDEAEAKHFNDFVKLGLSKDKLLRSIENERARRA